MRTMLLGLFIILASACGGGTTSPTSSIPTAPTATTPTVANISGNYNFTVTASSTCASSLPSSVRTLRYGATITQSGTFFQTSLTGGSLTNPSLVGSVSGQTVAISVAFGDTGISGIIGVNVIGSGNGTVASNGAINGTLNATIFVVGGNSCSAVDHQFTFTPR